MKKALYAAMLVLASSGGAAAACLTTGSTWTNTAFVAQTAAFTATFRAVPATAKMDGVNGLSAGSAADFTKLAAAVRFNNQGYIDARNGGAYAAATQVPYTAGTAYSFKMAVDMLAKRYSAWVTGPDGVERQLASNYAFRTEQASVSRLDNLAAVATAGTEQLCDVLAPQNTTPVVDTTPPSATIASPLAGATLSGVAPVSGSASDNVGVKTVEVTVDGLGYSPALGTTAWSFQLNTAGLSGGQHKLTVRVKDAAGNPAWVSRTFNVGDTVAPAVSLVSPTAGATVSGGAYRVEAAATDAVGVAGVQFFVDGAPAGAEDTTAPYAITWDTTKVAEGSHVLTATARDAAGNKATSAAVTATVKNIQADGFGVRMLYPTLSGGKNWVSKWNTARSWNQATADPADSWFDTNAGEASYRTTGDGQLYITGVAPRMYVRNPTLADQWHNVEVTIYAKRVADGGTAYGGIVTHVRANHGATGDVTKDHCDTRGIGGRFRYDGATDFEKETSHPNSVPTANKRLWSGSMPKNIWIGYKYVVYDLPNGNVKLETYMDSTDGKNGGTWVKVNELEDNGSNLGVGGVPCKSGINPAMKLTASHWRDGSESGKPNVSVYFRSDNVYKDGLVYKKVSVREISVGGTTTSGR